ncbi:MAG: universal stress protein [Deltaproteobacteria bacterium]|nr:universal stress protein [Deltaproteobacteria bacterium]
MRMENILVATDFSLSAETAYSLVVQLAKRTNADVALLHVDESHGFHSSEELTDYLDRIAVYRRQLVDKALDFFRRNEIEPVLHQVSGVASEQIVALAGDLDADLVVMAKHGARTSSEHLLLGSTTTRVLRSCPVPMLIVPQQLSPHLAQPPQRLLVSTDFSDDSRRGLDHAVTLAEQLSLEIGLIHVLRLPYLIPAIPGELVPAHVPGSLTNRWQTDANSQLTSEARRVSTVTVTPQLVLGTSVAVELAQQAQPADLLVIPSHGKGALRAMALGSNTASLVKLARNPLIVLPHAYLKRN